MVRKVIIILNKQYLCANVLSFCYLMSLSNFMKLGKVCLEIEFQNFKEININCGLEKRIEKKRKTAVDSDHFACLAVTQTFPNNSITTTAHWN